MSKIIVVDDDYATATLIKMLLEMEGYSVAATTTVANALAEPPGEVRAMIVDAYLANGESGLEFIRSVRQGETWLRADVPAILVSGDQRLTEEAKLAGADLFLLKPYSPDELTAHVARLAGVAEQDEPGGRDGMEKGVNDL
jgi:CheY-like chemotaxis protein